MGLTRRGFIKRALTAGALALMPSLPGLPGATQEGRWWGRVVAKPAPDPRFAEYQYSGPGPAMSRTLSDLAILEQHSIELSSQFGSLQAGELDARIIAMLGNTGIVSFPGLMPLWDVPEGGDVWGRCISNDEKSTI